MYCWTPTLLIACSVHGVVCDMCIHLLWCIPHDFVFVITTCNDLSNYKVKAGSYRFIICLGSAIMRIELK